jgi:hypothetical protein
MFRLLSKEIDLLKKKQIPYCEIQCDDCRKVYRFREDRVPDACQCYKVNYKANTWNEIAGYNGLYEVSTSGIVISTGNKSNSKTIKQLKPFVSGSGYPEVILCKDGITKHHTIHRLIMEAFIENTESKPQINHIDGNKTNSVLENLEWVTASENQIHYIKELKCK